MQRYVCALSTVSLYKYTRDRQTAAGPIDALAHGRVRACVLARSLARASARSPLYRYFCSGLSFLSGAPLLHPTMVYLKCHGGEGVHAHAHAQCSEPDVGQQAGYGLYTGRVAKPLTYTCAPCMCTRVHVHTASHRSTQVCTCARVRALVYYVRAHSTAILRRSANQWRNCKPVHPRGPPYIRSYIHARRGGFPISFASSFFPLFFHSIDFHRFTGCPPSFAPKLFYVRRESRLRGGS